MIFANPQYLHGLYVLPFLAVLFFYGAKQRDKGLRQFSGEAMSARLAPGRSWRKNLLKSTLKTLGVALLIRLSPVMS